MRVILRIRPRVASGCRHSYAEPANVMQAGTATAGSGQQPSHVPEDRFRHECRADHGRMGAAFARRGWLALYSDRGRLPPGKEGSESTYEIQACATTAGGPHRKDAITHR